MAVVEDTLTWALGDNPHVVQGINELLTEHEHLAIQPTVASRAVGIESRLRDAIVAKELGEGLGQFRYLGGEICESSGLRHDRYKRI